MAKRNAGASGRPKTRKALMFFFLVGVFFLNVFDLFLPMDFCVGAFQENFFFVSLFSWSVFCSQLLLKSRRAKHPTESFLPVCNLLLRSTAFLSPGKRRQ